VLGSRFGFVAGQPRRSVFCARESVTVVCAWRLSVAIGLLS